MDLKSKIKDKLNNDKSVLIQAKVPRKLAIQLEKAALEHGVPASKIMVACIDIVLTEYGKSKS